MLTNTSDMIVRDPVLFGLAMLVDSRSAACPCGSDVDHGTRSYGCFACGIVCCAECAITLESMTYCRHCAAALLDAPAVRGSGVFELV